MSSSRPEMDPEALSQIKKDRTAAEARTKEKKEYGYRYTPQTVTGYIGSEELEHDWFKEGEWGPGWGVVEFVSVFPRSVLCGI
jgi:hypothetical protein